VRVFSAAGHGFGTTKGTVEYGTITIPAADVSWNDNYVEFYIPRKVGANYISAGSANVKITNAVGNDSRSFTVRPGITAIVPSTGAGGTSVTLYGFALGATGSPVTVNFGGGNVNATSYRDFDTDNVTFNVPAASAVGPNNVFVAVNSQNSNTLVFIVTPAGAPTITQIIPNAAPNTADINGVIIKGTNFQTGATVVLNMSGQPAITGTVTAVSATKITVNLPINGKTVGKWNVVVTNPGGQSAT
jgi:hypothetical protein